MKHVVKVEKSGLAFRINIPRRIVMEKCWGDAQYVLVEDHHPDKIVIRRLIDAESLKGEDPRD